MARHPQKNCSQSLWRALERFIGIKQLIVVYDRMKTERGLLALQ